MNTTIRGHGTTEQRQEPSVLPSSNCGHLYRLPTTHYVRRQRAANHHIYAIQAPTLESLPTPRPGYWAREMAKFRAALSQTWSNLKAMGRRLVRWLMWRVAVPLAVLSCLWVAYAEPAELGM